MHSSQYIGVRRQEIVSGLGSQAIVHSSQISRVILNHRLGLGHPSPLGEGRVRPEFTVHTSDPKQEWSFTFLQASVFCLPRLTPDSYLLSPSYPQTASDRDRNNIPSVPVALHGCRLRPHGLREAPGFGRHSEWWTADGPPRSPFYRH